MPLLGSKHKERYDQMKSEINTRNTEWWYYRSGEKSITKDLQGILDMLKEEFLEVGPFGPRFVKENKVGYKPSFYDIPLQHVFADEHTSSFEGVAYVATNGHAGIMLRAIHDYFRNNDNFNDFLELKLTAICVQRASAISGDSMVVSVDCIEDLRPLTFYEHPPNGRLLMAMTDSDLPEHSAITLCGNRCGAKFSLEEVCSEATKFYNDYELDGISAQELSEKLFSFFSEA